MSEPIQVGVSGDSGKRIRRTAEEKLRIVEATFEPGASIARVAREHGVNANQVFQWRYEYRKGTLRDGSNRAKLLPVTLTAEPGNVMVQEAAQPAASAGAIHIELPGRALMSVEGNVDKALVRAVPESLLR